MHAYSKKLTLDICSMRQMDSQSNFCNNCYSNNGLDHFLWDHFPLCMMFRLHLKVGSPVFMHITQCTMFKQRKCISVPRRHMTFSAHIGQWPMPIDIDKKYIDYWSHCQSMVINADLCRLIYFNICPMLIVIYRHWTCWRTWRIIEKNWLALNGFSDQCSDIGHWSRKPVVSKSIPGLSGIGLWNWIRGFHWDRIDYGDTPAIKKLNQDSRAVTNL